MIEPGMGRLSPSRTVVEAGFVLYGKNYRTALAKALGVPPTMIGAYVSGTTQVPPIHFARLETLLHMKRQKINLLIEALHHGRSFQTGIKTAL